MGRIVMSVVTLISCCLVVAAPSLADQCFAFDPVFIQSDERSAPDGTPETATMTTAPESSDSTFYFGGRLPAAHPAVQLPQKNGDKETAPLYEQLLRFLQNE